MTTTVMFSGKEGKNTSKVLAPPGGKTSVSLFGGYGEDPTPAQPKNQRQSNPPFASADMTPPAPAQNQRKSNIVFGSEESPAPAQNQRKAPSQSPFAQDSPPETTGQRKAPSQSPFAQDYPSGQAAQRRAPSQAPFAQDSTGPAKPFKPVSTFSLSGSPSAAQQQQQTQNASSRQEPNNPDNKTSIKIANPPGGRSSIQF
ncbi:skin secretory protein xP2-like [Lytechinus pictus]|uniref:skin secretory protein xP2-like n=1 Tax=Lytechinus pictus TaxID=7653 RepID=UPI0030B9E51A